MLKFLWLDDEECEIYLFENYITTMSHDNLGWDGMRHMERTLKDIAESAGWPVVVAGAPGV